MAKLPFRRLAALLAWDRLTFPGRGQGAIVKGFGECSVLLCQKVTKPYYRPKMFDRIWLDHRSNRPFSQLIFGYQFSEDSSFQPRRVERYQTTSVIGAVSEAYQL